MWSTIPHLLTHLWHRKFQGEQKKVITPLSLWIAFRRCGVHVLPTLFSIVIVTLNLKGYYIGQQFASLIRDY